jgi:hypothetical protein
MGRKKERVLRRKRIKICYMYIIEDSIMKPTKAVKKKKRWEKEEKQV